MRTAVALVLSANDEGMRERSKAKLGPLADRADLATEDTMNFLEGGKPCISARSVSSSTTALSSVAT